MKPRIFITTSYEGDANKQEIEHLCGLISASGFKDFCFIRDIENYKTIFNTPIELMSKTKVEIEKKTDPNLWYKYLQRLKTEKFEITYSVTNLFWLN